MTRIPGSIMAIDDDEGIREALQTVLALRYEAVCTTSTGDEALQMLRQGLNPALILLDLRMPGMSGSEFVERLQADPRLRDIPFIVLSGDPAAKVAAESMGARGCLAKPIGVHDLLAAIQKWMTP